MPKFMILLVLVGLLSACGREKFSGDPASPLGSTPALYLARPDDYRPAFADAQVGYGYFQGSGQITQALLAESFRRKFDLFTIAPEARVLDDDILFARSVGARYMVRPVILHWRDDNKSREATVRMVVYDTRSLEILDEEIIEVDGSKSPVYYLKDEFEDYADDWDYD